jgi:OOP family OmpA-OmpF porin
MMKKLWATKIVANAVVGAALLAGATAVSAHNEGLGYVYDANGVAVRDGSGNCVRTNYWVPALATLACDPGLIKKPEPVKVVAPPPPPPPPAPVVEAPPPVPVVVTPPPPPPPPAPVYKTEVISKPITIEGTGFDTGSAKLKKAADAKLGEVVDFAKANPGSDLLITGYTDNQGSEAKNVKLSAARAEAVKAYLVKKGVAADRISTKGLGSANPVGDNKTVAGRAANRRVEITSSIKEEKKVRVN